MTVPVVWSLAKQYPDVRITVLSRRFARPLFEDLAPNVGFMEADLQHEYHGVRGLNTLYRRLTAKHFTAVADLHSVLRSEYLRLRFNMGRYKVAHINKHRQGKRMLTRKTDKVVEQQPSALKNYTDVLAKLGYPVKLTFRSIFPEGKGDAALLPPNIRELLGASCLIGLAPFAAHEGKIYPLHLMEQVIDLLAERLPGCQVFLFGGGEREFKVFGEWQQRHPHCVNASVALNGLKQELVLMSHLDVMISMDSGNMHLASLTDTPVVSVWGATHPFAGFMGYRQTDDSVVQLDMPCRPCSIYGNKPCLRGDYACMHNISPEMVVDRVISKLRIES